MSPRAPCFTLSTPHHGLQRTEEVSPLAQLNHMLHLTALAQQQHRQGVSAAAALPSRYYTTNPGFLFPERSEVPKQAFSFSPVFRLAHFASSSSSTAAHAGVTLSHESVVALRPTSDLVRLPSPSAAAANSAVQQQQQQQRQRDSCQPEQPHHFPQQPHYPQPQPHQPRQHKRKQQKDCLSLQAPGLPWLGARLDVGGYTKRGWISGGGKEQNQDRGLILEEFRSPNELLLGVMDGHGTSGHLVSTYLAQHLPALLLQHLVAAAAALGSGGSNVQQQSKQRKLFGRSQHHQQQQQRQQESDQELLQFVISPLPYVLMPETWPKYGAAPAADSAQAYSAAAAPGQQQQQQQQGRTHTGRAVGKQQVVQQQMQSHPLDDDSTSTTSSSSSSSSSSYSHSSSQQWLSPVSHASVRQVALSQELLSAAFTATDAFLSGSGINVVDSGSTALLCHIGPSSITTAWVGDSRAVLGRRRQLLQAWPKQQQLGQQQQQLGQEPLQQQQQRPEQSSWEAIPLSVDHKPERHDEFSRISQQEGRVAQIMGRGPYRVWFKGIDYPGLAMSRAFGDLPCRRIGVTVEPEVTVHPLAAEDELLVAATDGIWDVLSNEEVVSLAGSAVGAQAAARALVEVAEARWLETEGGYIDDITAVVVRAAPAAAAAAAAAAAS